MLLSISELIETSLTTYLKNWRRLLTYAACLFLPTVVLAILGLASIYSEAAMPSLTLINSIIVILFFLISIIFGIWATIALIKASRQALLGDIYPWRQNFRSGASLIWPFMLTSLLAGLVVAGGTLLLIVPGIIFTVWYALSIYAAILDEQLPFAALRASKNLAIGRWWQMLWRLAIPGIIFIVAAALIRAVLILPFIFVTASAPIINAIDNILTALANAVVAPAAALAMVALYDNAKQNPFVPQSPPPMAKQ